MNQLQLVKIVAAAMAGQSPSESDIAKLLQSLGSSFTVLGDHQQIEHGIVELAQAALVPGVRVLEVTGQPKMLNGKKIRCIAIIE